MVGIDFHNLAPAVDHLGTVPETLTYHIYICERVKVIIPNTPNIPYICKLYYLVHKLLETLYILK